VRFIEFMDVGTAGTDLRAALRSGVTDSQLADLKAGRWRARTDRYSELRGAHATDPRQPGRASRCPTSAADPHRRPREPGDITSRMQLHR
jgi:hypothetical protein